MVAAVNYAREGNIEKAYEYTTRYFDEIMLLDYNATNELASDLELGNDMEEVLGCRRNRTIKFGLIFTARLARINGHL